MNPIGRSVTRHALGWFAAANLVGVMLSSLVVWPALNSTLAPLTYGRWMPLHLDWELYGWCALPLLGLLLFWFLPTDDPASAPLARVALISWSSALAVGGVSWLSGHSSGKLFLEWSGAFRAALPAAMLISWFTLAVGFVRHRTRRSAGANVARVIALLLLLPVPAVLYRALSPTVFPAVNPDSGGATGTTLLGSTLGILAIGAIVPWLLNVPSVVSGRIRPICAGWFVFSCVLFASIDHGAVSHHRLSQVLVLASVFGWIPLAPAYFQTFAWSSAARPWLRWAAIWWVALMIDGWISFLPGVSERIKFTHHFVAHGHLAMAGLVTSIHGAILVTLGGGAWTSRRLLKVWQFANLGHILVLSGIGLLEMYSTSEFFLNVSAVPVLFALRLAAGAVMAFPTVVWWWRSLR